MVSSDRQFLSNITKKISVIITHIQYTLYIHIVYAKNIVIIYYLF